MNNLYVVWHFKGTVAQLQAIVDTEEKAQMACDVYDCYMPMELNKVYKEEYESTEIALYKCPDGSFKPAQELSSII